MNEAHSLYDVVAFLGAAVIFVPIAQKLGLGSVLGYLIAGAVLGPWGLRTVTETSHISHVSEFGVVFLLFVIGLELEPKRLWDWRTPIFGMGTAQVLLVSGLTASAALLAGFTGPAAVVAGLGFALSSTAIASHILHERNLMKTTGGSSAFSILLFQDMAVIPILAVLPLLAGVRTNGEGASITVALGAVVGVILAGRYLLRHLFRVVASAQQREVFTAMSLLLVVGLAALMQSLGISMALGAFLGGVLLATSEYRRAVETDIDPFKGLLLGLFFMSVGMGVDHGTLAARPGSVALAFFAAIMIKISAHAAIAFLFRMPRKEIPFFATILSQVGEFAFVLFATATTLGLLGKEEAAILSAATALSMATTPLLVRVYDAWIAPRLARTKDLSDEKVVDDDPEVLIAGFGRVGQIVGRLLYANRIRATVLDHDPEQIEILRQFGFKVYYGDATRLDLLAAAGAAKAKVLVVAVDDVEDSLEIVDIAKEHFPHLQIVARARNVAHVNSLIEKGVSLWERETFDSSLRMGTEALRLLGLPAYQAVRAGHKFRDHNLKLIAELVGKRGNRDLLISTSKQARADLENMFTGERESLRRQDEGWESKG